MNRERLAMDGQAAGPVPATGRVPGSGRPNGFDRSAGARRAGVWAAALLVVAGGVFGIGSAVAQPATQALPAENSPSALAAFERFAEGLQSLDATFVQTLTDETGFEIARSEGRLAAEMPGRLDWEVIAPQPQRIVADGQELWNYEPALSQVIVQRQGALAAGSPLQVLAEPARVVSSFRVVDAEPLSAETLTLIEERRRSYAAGQEANGALSDPATWTGVRLIPLETPEGRHGEFTEVELWIDPAQKLGVIAFVDLFGQRTEMVMTSFLRNVEVPRSRFTFVLPDGVDVFRP